MVLDIGSMIIGAIITQAARVFVDSAYNSSYLARFKVQSIFQTENELYSTYIDYDTVENHAVKSCFTRALRYKLGGLLVLGGPRGSSKTTTMVEAVSHFREKYKRIVVMKHGASCLRDRSLHAQLGVPKTDQLSRYVPTGSVIVVDQVDLTPEQFDSNMREYLVDLATDSFNNRKFHVIIVVSSALLFRQLLNLNDGEKIADVCNPLDLKWSADLLQDLVNQRFPEWSPEERGGMKDAVVPSSLPAMVSKSRASVESAEAVSPLPRAAVIQTASDQAAAKAVKWLEFETASAGYAFQGIVVHPT